VSTKLFSCGADIICIITNEIIIMAFEAHQELAWKHKMAARSLVRSNPEAARAYEALARFEENLAAEDYAKAETITANTMEREPFNDI